MIKYIIKIALISVLLIATANANSIDFYWEKNNSWDVSSTKNIEQLNSKLESFYKKTWLNTDLIILWKWDSCYLKTNFDSCIQKRENYSSDLIIVLSMKSNIKSRWDIRSLIKDEFKESITPRELKNIQDSITHYFKNEDFKWWLTKFLDNLENKIYLKCREVWISNSCNAVKLAKEYHNYIAKKEYEKKYNAMMKIIYYIISVIWIVLWYLWLRSFYIKQINNLYKDVKYKSTALDEFDLFKKDRKSILDDLKNLKIKLKIKLWDLEKNVFNLRKFYKKNINKFEKINKELEDMQENYEKREELKNKLDKMKKIDL